MSSRQPSALIHVSVNGRSVEVQSGTSIAAVLATQGLHGTRTSVSGEARGPLCGMGICQECRVTVDGRAHVLACQTLCREGQIIQTTAP